MQLPDAISNDPGARISAAETSRGILRHEDGGPVILFVPSEQVPAYTEELRYWATVENGVNPDVRVASLSSLPSELRNGNVQALHWLDNQLDAPVYARAVAAQSLIPVTCMQYSFSFQRKLPEWTVHQMLAPTYACDSVICTTNVAKTATVNILERLRGELEGRYKAALQADFRVDVIPRGICTDTYRPRDRQEMRYHLALPQRPVILLFTGRIDPATKADPIPLLIAFRQIVARHGDGVILVFAGPVSERYRANLTALLGEMGLDRHVILRSDIPAGNVPLYYSAADVFVSLSDTLQENFGRTPVEAMSSGLPVVVSDWGGYRETVIHGQTGFKIPTLWADCDQDLWPLSPFVDWASDHFAMAQSVAIDIPSLTDALDRLIANEEFRRGMGTRARQHALSNFTWQRCAGMYWALWLELGESARQLRSVPGPASELLRPHYFQDFREFATRQVDASTRLHMTERGKIVCKGKERLLLVGDAKNILQADLLLQLLRYIRFVTAIRYPVLLEDLELLFARKRATNVSAVRRHVLWLIKYDLLHADCEPQPEKTPDKGRIQ